MDADLRTRPSTAAPKQPGSAAMESEYSDRQHLMKSRSSGRLQSAAIERRLTISGDPRDSGKAGPLTSTSPSPATAPADSLSRPPLPQPLPSSSASPAVVASPRSHLSSFQPSSPSRLNHPPSSPFTPRLPQSRFSFEVQHPLRKIALTSHLKSSSVDRSPPVSDSIDIGSAGVQPSHVDTAPASDPLRTAPSTQAGRSALSPGTGSNVRGLSPNAPKRRKSTLHSQQTPQSVKRRMPSSTAAFSQGRSNANENGSSVKGAERYGLQDGLRSSNADETRARNDDIFLNIARSDSGRRESLGRSELRRVS